MIAFDTLMLVRALPAEHIAQVAVVKQLISGDSVFVSRTVLLETEVLRARYKNTSTEMLRLFGVHHSH